MPREEKQASNLEASTLTRMAQRWTQYQLDWTKQQPPTATYGNREIT